MSKIDPVAAAGGLGMLYVGYELLFNGLGSQTDASKCTSTGGRLWQAITKLTKTANSCPDSGAPPSTGPLPPIPAPAPSPGGLPAVPPAVTLPGRCGPNGGGTIFTSLAYAEGLYNSSGGASTFDANNYVSACGGGYVVLVKGGFI